MSKRRKENKNDLKDFPFELGELDFYRLNQRRKYPGALFNKDEKFSSGITGEENIKSFQAFPQKKRAPQDSDHVIYEKISELLSENGLIPVEDVIFSVRHGVVILSGRVPDSEKLKTIKKSVRLIPGVKKIINELFTAGISDDEWDDSFFNP